MSKTFRSGSAREVKPISDLRASFDHSGHESLDNDLPHLATKISGREILIILTLAGVGLLFGLVFAIFLAT